MAEKSYRAVGTELCDRWNKEAEVEKDKGGVLDGTEICSTQVRMTLQSWKVMAAPFQGWEQVQTPF